MKEIKCPDSVATKMDVPFMVFLGGGITGCPDWQSEMVPLLSDSDGVLFNPRRQEFDVTDQTLLDQQIEWEYKHLKMTDSVMFWFPKETVCPITLYELGVWSNRRATSIHVGCHPEYSRKYDIVKQLSLSRPDITVVFSLEDLAKQIKVEADEWIN